MNRRNIFKLLTGVACAAAMEITGTVPSVAQVVKRAKVAIINPDYLSAAFEDMVIWNPDAMELCRSPISGNAPNRYDLIDGHYVQRPCYKEVEIDV